MLGAAQLEMPPRPEESDPDLADETVEAAEPPGPVPVLRRTRSPPTARCTSAPTAGRARRRSGCPDCHSEVEPGWRHCVNCGAAVRRGASAVSHLDRTLRPQDVVAVIMGGGAGTRLFPLTKDRAKPAVPLAGKYRLVDIPISNCLNSDLRRIFVLTQFNSSSLHRHIQESYRFDNFSPGFVEILAAQQTDRPRSTGTRAPPTPCGRTCSTSRLSAPAGAHPLGRPALPHGLPRRPRAARRERRRGDRGHHAGGAPRGRARFGIMQVAADRRITRFVEKPRTRTLLRRAAGGLGRGRGPGEPWTPTRSPPRWASTSSTATCSTTRSPGPRSTSASTSFPRSSRPTGSIAFQYQGYWEDIGTIRSFYEANLDLCEPLPKFNFYDATAPIFTHARYLPGHQDHQEPDRALRHRRRLHHQRRRSSSTRSIGRAEPDPGRRDHPRLARHGGGLLRDARPAAPAGAPPIGIGQGAWIERTIVDKNARIGDDVAHHARRQAAHFDGPNFYVRDGIVVIPKNAVIMSGTVI